MTDLNYAGVGGGCFPGLGRDAIIIFLAILIIIVAGTGFFGFRPGIG